jgi:hypothetical protein
MIKVIFKDDFNFDILKDEIKVGSGNFIAEEDDTLGNNPYLNYGRI